MIRIAVLNPFFIAFLVLPPLLVIARLKNKIPIPMLVLFMTYVLVGWFFVFAGIELYYEMLSKLIDSTPNAPDEWIERLVDDGGTRTFGLFFGWLYAIIYFLVWFIPIWFLAKLRCLFKAKVLPKPKKPKDDPKQ